MNGKALLSMKNIYSTICKHIFVDHTNYSLRLKLYDVLGISHILRNAINIVWKRDIMSCFIKLSLINNMRKINERIEIRE